MLQEAMIESRGFRILSEQEMSGVSGGWAGVENPTFDGQTLGADGQQFWRSLYEAVRDWAVGAGLDQLVDGIFGDGGGQPNNSTNSGQQTLALLYAAAGEPVETHEGNFGDMLHRMGDGTYFYDGNGDGNPDLMLRQDANGSWQQYDGNTWSNSQMIGG